MKLSRYLLPDAPDVLALGLEPVLEEGIREFDSAHTAYVPVEELRAAAQRAIERYGTDILEYGTTAKAKTPVAT